MAGASYFNERTVGQPEVLSLSETVGFTRRHTAALVDAPATPRMAWRIARLCCYFGPCGTIGLAFLSLRKDLANALLVLWL